MQEKLFEKFEELFGDIHRMHTFTFLQDALISSENIQTIMGDMYSHVH